MAGKSRFFNTTCICFNSSDKVESQCYKIFDFFGRYKKLQLQFLLASNFPEYYKTGIINDELNGLIEKYKKDYNFDKTDAPLFFGWKYIDDEQDQRSDVLLNKKLGGGAKDFIVYLLTKTYPYMFEDNYDVIETVNPQKSKDNSDNFVMEITPDEEDDDEDKDFLYMIRHQFDHMNISTSNEKNDDEEQ